MLLQNSPQGKVSMFLKGGWFIIAGVLLLGHTSVLAEPYLRVRKNGVIYYYYSSRESPPPRQGGMNSRAWRGVPPEPLTRPTPGEKEALIQEPSTRHHLPVTAHIGKSSIPPIQKNIFGRAPAISLVC